jgi:hypothetical protein
LFEAESVAVLEALQMVLFVRLQPLQTSVDMHPQATGMRRGLCCEGTKKLRGNRAQ